MSRAVSEALPLDDAWDWPLLMYTATVILKRTEAEFWRMTPRKLSALAAKHVDLNKSPNSKETAKRGYIDQVM
ncbi:hypothetical protein D1872_73130 [compost metagenome]